MEAEGREGNRWGVVCSAARELVCSAARELVRSAEREGVERAGVVGLGWGWDVPFDLAVGVSSSPSPLYFLVGCSAGFVCQRD